MKKTIKRLLAMMLVVVMTIGTAPLSGFVGIELPEFDGFKKLADSVSEHFNGFGTRAEATETSGACGDNLTWSFDELTGELVISGTGDMWYENSSYSPWIDLRDYIEKVTVVNGVTSIGAFAYCTNLINISIPDSVTKIYGNAFKGCTNLVSINISENITSIGQLAFEDCSNLIISIDKNNPQFSNDENGNVFNKDKTKLVMYLAANKQENYIIPDCVTSINQYAFDNSNIKSITISNNVRSIDVDAFWNCENLSEFIVAENNLNFSNDEYGVLFDKNKTQLIRYPNGNKKLSYDIPYGVEHIDADAFANCTNLTRITIPKSITRIDYRAFNGFVSLTDIMIPESVTSIDYGAFQNCVNLTSIIIPDSVTNIGNSCFEYCENLSSVAIGNGVTQISSSMFRKCSKLMQITIPDSVTSIGDNAFADCTSLENLIIPDSVIVIDYQAFSGCANLMNVVLGKNVTSLGNGVLSGCIRLESIIIPDSVTSIGERPFGNCVGLKSVVIGNGIKSIDNGMFSQCENLVTITIPDSVTSIGHSAFEYCENLKNVIIPNSVTSIGTQAFFACSSLEDIAIPKGVTNIGEYTFMYNTNLKTVTIPDSVVNIGELAFAECNKLSDVFYGGTEEQWNSIDIDSNNVPLELATIHFMGSSEHIGNKCGENLFWSFFDSTGTLVINGTGDMYYWKDYESVPWHENISDIKKVIIQNGATSIGNRAFAYCENLSSISLPETLIRIGFSAFNGCSNLSDIIIPENVEIIEDYAFMECDELKEIEIPQGVTAINSYTFALCHSLVDVTIPKGVTSIGKFSFEDCDSLTNIVIPSTVTNIGESAFYTCDSLSEIVIPESVTNIDDRAFYSCTKLASVTIGENVSVIGDEAFRGCYNLSGILIPSSVISLGEAAFSSCYCLTDITVESSNKFYASDENGVLFNKDKTELIQYPIGNARKRYDIPTNVANIGRYAFYYCENLLSVSFSDNVRKINEFAFSICKNLSDVYYYKSKKEWDTTQIQSNNESLLNATIHYNYSEIYVVSYDANGGEGGPERQEKLHDVDLILSSIMPTKTCTIMYDANGGKISNKNITVSSSFLGWTTEPNGDGDYYSYGDTYKDNCDITLYAQWFDQAFSEPSVPKREGYVFEGWYTAANGGTEVTESTIITNDITVYAHWTKATSYILTYDVNGGVGTVDKQTGDDSYIISSSVPTRSGYNFIGWSTDKKSTTAEYVPGDTVNLTVDTTLYAVWAKRRYLLTESDIFSFVNSGRNFKTGTYTMTDTDFIKLTDYVRNMYNAKTAETYINRLQVARSDAWSGSCFGMSMSVILNKTGQIDFVENFDPSAANMYAVARPYQNVAVQSAINYYQISQRVNGFRTTTYTVDKGNFSKGLEKLVNTVKDGNMTLLIYSWPKGCHAIVIVGYEKAEDGGHNLIAYDNRYGSKYINVYVDEEYNTCIVNGKEEAYYVEFNTNFSIFDKIDIDGPGNDMIFTSSSESIGTEIGVKLNGNITVKNAEGETLTVNNGIIGGNMEVLSSYMLVNSTSDDASVPGTLMLEVEDSDSFTFDSTADEITASLTTEDRHAEVTATADKVIISEDEGIYTTGDDVEFNGWLSLNNDMGDVINFEGQGNSEVNFLYGNDDEIIIEGAKDESTLTVYSDLVDVDAVTFSSEYETLNISGEKDNIAITTSSKNDGIFDVKVAEISNAESVVAIAKPSTTTINCGDSIILHADISNIPNGGYVEWKASNDCFTYTVSEDGLTCKITSDSNGSTVFTVTIYDAEKNVVSQAEQTMNSKAGFFQKIFAFFKKLFDLTKTIPQIYKDIF